MKVTWVFVVYAVSGNVPPQSIEVQTAGFYSSVLECARESVTYNHAPSENNLISACMPIVSEDDATTKN